MTELLHIRETKNRNAQCWWCGGDHTNSEQMFLTPEAKPRAICDCCVENNDWCLGTSTGVLMWRYTMHIKLVWQEATHAA